MNDVVQDGDEFVNAEQQAQNAAAIASFSIGPGVATNTVIDFAGSAGIKLFAAATRSLYGDKANRFNVDAEGIHSFMGLIEEHSQYHGLNGGTGILDIPVDQNDPLGETKSLVTSYGMVTLNQVRDNVRTYVLLPCRATQDSAMFFRCIMESLSVKGRNKVRIWKEDYTIKGHLSGALLLKVVIRQSHVDTNATTRHIRLKFTRLDTTFAKMDYDVEQLNLYVRTWLDALAARGGSTEDVFVYLLKAYKTSPDAELVEYVKYKEREYDDGWEVTDNELMQLVGNKYALRAEEDDAEGGEIKEDGIIALQAQVEELKQELSYRAGPTTKFGSNVKSGQSAKSGGRPPMESWKKVAPTASEITKGSKTVNGKEFFYCAKHGYWCAHVTKDCKSPLKTEGNKPTAEQKRLVSAMMAMQEDDDEDSE